MLINYSTYLKRNPCVHFLFLFKISFALSRENNSTTRSDSGQVRVYKYSNSSWPQLGVDIDGKAGW